MRELINFDLAVFELAVLTLQLLVFAGNGLAVLLALVHDPGYTAHLHSRGEEQRDLRALGYRARRWVVERTHGWLNRCRGLLIRWAKKTENYLAFVHLACGIITWRATGPLG